MLEKIIINEDNPEKIKEVLQNGIREYNYPFLGQYKLKRFAIYIQNDSAEIIAGISGFIIEKHKTVRLEFLWVREDLRNQGLGTKLCQRLDDYALHNQCKFIQASTMEFQGPTFYHKMGYQSVGVIPQWFCDSDEIFFLKKL